MAGYSNLGRVQERQRESDARGKIPGWAEPFATLGSGLASSTLGGLAALGTVPANLLGLSKSSPADVLSTIQQNYTYAPRSTEGQAALHAIGTVAEKIHEPVAWAAGKTLEATGSPALATAVDVAPTALGALAGLPSGPVSGAARAARAAIPNTTPSRAGLGPGIRGQQGSFLPAELVVDPKNLARALAMSRIGGDVSEIWRKTGVWVPTDDPMAPQPPQGRALAEVVDFPSNATPINLARPDTAEVGKLNDLMKSYDTWMQYALLRQGGMPAEQAIDRVKHLPGARSIDPRMPVVPGAIVNKMQLAQMKLENLTAPKYGGTLETAIEHPELFSALPRLRDVKFETVPTMEFAGKYHPIKDVITISRNLGGEEAPKTLIHEINHAIQQHTGLPPGMNPKNAHTRLIQARAGNLVEDQMFNLLMKMSSDAVYTRAWGEALSNSTMNRLPLDKYQRRADPPWNYFTDTAGKKIPHHQLWEPLR